MRKKMSNDDALESNDDSDPGATQSESLSPDGRPTFVAEASPPPTRAVSISQFSELYSGPYPHPEHLRQMAESYPDAPRVVFEDYQEQARHRRELEKQVIQSKIRLADRGQWIGGALGFVGIVGSFIVVCMGHDWAGVALGGGSLLGLVSVFVLGRKEEKQERLEKREIQERMRRGDSIEAAEQVE